MRLILLSLTLVVPLLGGFASVHGADSNPKHQLPLESIMSGCYGRAADIAGDNLDRPVLAYSVEKLFSGDFKIDVEGSSTPCSFSLHRL